MEMGFMMSSPNLLLHLLNIEKGRVLYGNHVSLTMQYQQLMLKYAARSWHFSIFTLSRLCEKYLQQC